MNQLKSKIVTGLFLAFTTLSAQATIVSGTITGGTAQTAGAVFVELTPPLANPYGTPNSVGLDNFNSPNMFGFDEDQNIVLSSSLVVDVGSTLAAGTTVASHYIFFDPATALSITGTVTFDSTVLAVIIGTYTLQASDFLADTGVNYLSPGHRGLEGTDYVTISGTNEITFSVSARTPGDYIRVITAYSPGGDPNFVSEPATLALTGLGLLALGGFARKSKELRT